MALLNSKRVRESNGIDYIRDAYGVPAKRGGRVLYESGAKGIAAEYGTITGASGPHVLIRLDGERWSNPHHPTSNLAYLDKDGKIIDDRRKEETT